MDTFDYFVLQINTFTEKFGAKKRVCTVQNTERSTQTLITTSTVSTQIQVEDFIDNSKFVSFYRLNGSFIRNNNASLYAMPGSIFDVKKSDGMISIKNYVFALYLYTSRLP